MPAKLWCGHAEGFESGLRALELDVGERDHASGTASSDAVKYTVMMNMAPIFLRSSLQLGTYASSAPLRTALLQSCYSSRNFGANRPFHLEIERAQTMTRGKSTLSRKARRRVKANTKTIKEIARVLFLSPDKIQSGTQPNKVAQGREFVLCPRDVG